MLSVIDFLYSLEASILVINANMEYITNMTTINAMIFFIVMKYR